MYQRLDEFGIDFAVLYPTYGLTVTALPNDELRRALARGLNRYYAEAYAGYRDRLEPVAAIPTFTPDEAIAELDYAVGELGLKAVMMSGAVPRPLGGPKPPAGRSGSTPWRTTRSTTTTRSGAGAWSSASRPRSTPGRRAGAAACRRPTTPTTRWATSRRPTKPSPARSSSAASPSASPISLSRFRRAASPGPTELLGNLLGPLGKAQCGGDPAQRPGEARQVAARGAVRAGTPRGCSAERRDQLFNDLAMLSDPDELARRHRHVRRVGIHERAGDHRRLQQPLLLRLRGRRPDERARVLPEPEPRRGSAAGRSSPPTSATGTCATCARCCPKRTNSSSTARSPRRTSRTSSSSIRPSSGPR